MQLGAFTLILGIIGIVSFFAYLTIGYFYLKKKEIEYFRNLFGSLWKEPYEMDLEVKQKGKPGKLLIKDRAFQEFITIIALLTLATVGTVTIFYILSPLFRNFSILDLSTGEEYAALFGGVILLFLVIYVWRKRREA